MNAQTGKRRREFAWMHGAGGQRPASIERPVGAMVTVGNHDAADRLSRMARPPADDDAAQVVLAQNVPQRFGFARKISDRLRAAPIRRRFGEAEDSVLERT